MVGDRGMITSARIAALREVGDLGWLTCLRAPQIAALANARIPAGETRRYEDNVLDILLENLDRLWAGTVPLVNQIV